MILLFFRVYSLISYFLSLYQYNDRVPRDCKIVLRFASNSAHSIAVHYGGFTGKFDYFFPENGRYILVTYCFFISYEELGLFVHNRHLVPFISHAAGLLNLP